MRPPLGDPVLLVASLALLALVVLIALAGLALDGSWPKVLRVAAAFAGYAGVLVVTVHAVGRRRGDEGPLPLWPFLAAGACAGALSGLVRPEFDVVRLAAQTAAAPLLGAVHAFGLERVRRQLGGGRMSNPGT